MYVIMKARRNPIAIGYDAPHLVMDTSRAAANQKVRELNNKASCNYYYAVKVPHFKFNTTKEF